MVPDTRYFGYFEARGSPHPRPLDARPIGAGLRGHDVERTLALNESDCADRVDVACNCQFCARLKAFIADPANEVGRIPAREDMRQHLIGIIDRHQCDVKHALERKGSPYSLVLTKTTGSFDRALKRFEADCRLLSALPNGFSADELSTAKNVS